MKLVLPGTSSTTPATVKGIPDFDIMFTVLFRIEPLPGKSTLDVSFDSKVVGVALFGSNLNPLGLMPNILAME
nr:hypothetical protein [Mucilaginibacter sp.]